MEKSQKINCTVHSCEYNINNQHECSLKQIKVTPTIGTETNSADESMCSSYRNNH